MKICEYIFVLLAVLFYVKLLYAMYDDVAWLQTTVS